MATIITIHGTNADGPEEATTAGRGHWWQKNSYFDLHIRQLVKPTNGVLSFVPVRWDGSNSEEERQRAGYALCNLIKEYEKSNEPYCVIGHSHGGSIIAHAALLSCSVKGVLSKWQTWITVGTPFIYAKRSLFLFSRLSTLGRAAYMIIVLYAIAAILVPFYLTDLFKIPDEIRASRSLDLVIQAGFAFVLLIPAILGTFLLSYLQPSHLRHHRSSIKERARLACEDKWVSLWHPDDEALQGLKRLHKIKIAPFSEQFATAAISLAAVFIIPLALFIISLRPDAVELLIQITNSDFPALNEFAASGTTLERFVAVVFIFISAPVRLLMPFFSGILNIQPGNVTVLIFGLTIGIISCWLIAILIYIPFSIFARLLGRWLSNSLNIVSRSHINQSALGVDTIGEQGMYAMEHPSWCSRNCPPLPPELCHEISSMSNIAAANSIKEFRDALDSIAFSDEDRNPTDLMAEYMTWKELIHTSYFHIPRFRKLVAYAISVSDGFQPTDFFKNDPDYELAASWYQEIIDGKGTTASNNS